MKSLRITINTALALVVSFYSLAAFSAPILEANSIVTIERNPDLVGLGITDVGDPLGIPVPAGDPTNLPFAGGTIDLTDKYGNPLSTSAPDPWWWEDWRDDPVYYTGTNFINIDFTGLAVTGVTFNIGINQNASGWIKTWYDTPTGSGTLKTQPNFTLTGGATAAPDSFGVYINDPAASCATISKVQIEPPLEWGIGNLGIRLADPSCGSVPEPGTNFLLGLGLLILGLGYQGRRRMAVVKA